MPKGMSMFQGCVSSGCSASTIALWVWGKAEGGGGGGTIKGGEITSQRLLDQSQAGVYMGKTPHTPHFGPIRVPYPKGLNC